MNQPRIYMCSPFVTLTVTIMKRKIHTAPFSNRHLDNSGLLDQVTELIYTKTSSVELQNSNNNNNDTHTHTQKKHII